MNKTKFHNLSSEKQKEIHRGMVAAGTQVPNRQTNRDFAEKNGKFRAVCDATDVEPTRRQAAKFRRKIGRAYNER